MTHDELEGMFNEYAVEGDDLNTDAVKAEKKLEKDISKLLKSKFFKKDVADVPEPELALETEDIQGELAATLGGVYSNVEKGVGAQMTEADDDDEEEKTEGSLTTEAATSEAASTTQ